MERALTNLFVHQFFVHGSENLFHLYIPLQRVPRVNVNLHVLEQEEITDYRILELPGQELQAPLPGSSGKLSV